MSLSLDDWETREDFLFFTVSQVGPLSLKKNCQDRFSNVTDLGTHWHLKNVQL